MSMPLRSSASQLPYYSQLGGSGMGVGRQEYYPPQQQEFSNNLRSMPQQSSISQLPYYNQSGFYPSRYPAASMLGSMFSSATDAPLSDAAPGNFNSSLLNAAAIGTSEASEHSFGHASGDGEGLHGKQFNKPQHCHRLSTIYQYKMSDEHRPPTLCSL